MLIYNLTEYSSNYSDTTGSFWFYSKDEATNFNAYIANNNVFKFFVYMTKLLINSSKKCSNFCAIKIPK